MRFFLSFHREMDFVARPTSKTEIEANNSRNVGKIPVHCAPVDGHHFRTCAFAKGARNVNYTKT